jgi:hypothetical protein
MEHMFSPFLSLMAEMITSTAGGTEGLLAGCFFLTLLALIGYYVYCKSRE